MHLPREHRLRPINRHTAPLVAGVTSDCAGRRIHFLCRCAVVRSACVRDLLRRGICFGQGHIVGTWKGVGDLQAPPRPSDDVNRCVRCHVPPDPPNGAPSNAHCEMCHWMHQAPNAHSIRCAIRWIIECVWRSLACTRDGFHGGLLLAAGGVAMSPWGVAGGRTGPWGSIRTARAPRQVFQRLLREIVYRERSCRWYLVGSEALPFPLIGSG